MSELTSAIKQVCEEKGLSYDAVVTTIESALAAAYRKDYGVKNQNIKVIFDPEKITSEVFDVKIVVEDMPEEELLEEDAESKVGDSVDKKSSIKEDKSKDYKKNNSEDEVPEEEERKFNPKIELQISDAKEIKKDVKVDDELKIKLEVPESYGRMAAQTAKQVIIQRLREAERDMVMREFKDKEGEVVGAVVQRQEGRTVLIDLGRSTGILLPDEQVRGERYEPGMRLKIFIKEVRLGSRGPEIIVSRTSPEILKKIFYLEIPEIANGLIELKSVARDAGARSKVAVWTDAENVDPIGSCVGQRGARIQTVIQEIGGEKIDIVEYSDSPVKFITNALSPAQVIGVDINEDKKEAVVTVAEDQLSLAIGKGGQNARLAAQLTGWKIDISSSELKDKAEDKDVKKNAKDESEDSVKDEVEEGDPEQKKEKKSKKKSIKTKNADTKDTDTEAKDVKDKDVTAEDK